MSLETPPVVLAPDYASTKQMLVWARGVMCREPDFVIGESYLRRWFIVPRNSFANLYLHEICRSDDDRALHDHPWVNSSYLLSGRYIEHTPEGEFLRVAGDFVERAATAFHRIELIGGEPVISLFATGPKVREWGFLCPHGWVHWTKFEEEHSRGKAQPLRGFAPSRAPVPTSSPESHT